MMHVKIPKVERDRERQRGRKGGRHLQMHVFYCCDGGLFIDPSFESRLFEVSHRYCFVPSVSAWRNINSAAAAKLNDLSAETDWILFLFFFPPPSLCLKGRLLT